MKLIETAIVILAAATLYLGVAGFVFQWRNPTANKAQQIRYFKELVTFQQLPEFQVDYQP